MKWYIGRTSPDARWVLLPEGEEAHAQEAGWEIIELVDARTLDAPTEVFQQGYESAIEDMKTGKLGPLYIAGLFDEHEFMHQQPPHDIHAYGPFTDCLEAVAKARTLSSDPDEAVVIEVKPA